MKKMHFAPICAPCKPGECREGCDLNSELQELDADKLIEQYGKWGLYQLLGYYLAVSFNFYVAVTYFLMPFIEKDPSKVCFDSKNHSLSEFYVDKDGPTAGCEIKNGSGAIYKCGEAGTSFNITDNKPIGSMIYEFDLLCTHYLLKEAGMSSFTIAAMCLVPLISHLADKFGRKPMLIVMVVLSATSSIVCAISSNYWFFVVARSVVGASTDGVATIASILSCELVVQDMRAYVGLVYTFAWVSGYFYVGLLSVFKMSWRMFYVFCTFPIFASLVYFLFIPESPYWLLAHNKLCRIKKYVEDSTNFNKQEINLSKCRISASRKQVRTEALQSENSEYKRAFQKPIFYAYIFINGFIQFVNQLYYFGLTLTSLTLSKDPFLGFMLSGMIEIPGGLIVIPLMKFFGRKPLMISSLILQGVFIAVSGFVKEAGFEWLAIGFNLLGKMANGVLQVVHPILVAEMMPTKMRTVMYSVVNIPQSLGILCAPYIKYTLIGGYAPSPMLILAVLSILGGTLAILVPETKGKCLPEDIEEMDEGIMGNCCSSKNKKKAPIPYDTGFGLLEFPKNSPSKEISPKNQLKTRRQKNWKKGVMI